MKKTLLALGLGSLILIPTQPAQAIIGFGLNLGQDSYTISGTNYSNLFGVPGIDLTRDELAQPIGIGAYLYVDLIPIVDLELGFDLYGNKYNYSFDNPVTEEHFEEELAWARTTTWISVQRNLLKVPMLKLYVGGGVNFSATAPIVTKEFMEDFLGSQTASLNPEALLDEIATNNGFHAELGLRFKPILIPFSIHVRYRQTFVEGIVPGEKSFSTIMVGGGIQF